VSFVRPFLAVLLCVAVFGCRGERSGFDRFIPAEEKAKTALEAALAAWQKGEPPGKIVTPTHAIQVADSQRRPGQRLREYQILGEAPADALCCYAVRLSLENPAQEQTVRFVVLGLDPIWVLRHEDYMMTLHWDMKMMKDQKPAIKK
jgi:hypothetical protein